MIGYMVGTGRGQEPDIAKVVESWLRGLASVLFSTGSPERVWLRERFQQSHVVERSPPRLDQTLGDQVGSAPD